VGNDGERAAAADFSDEGIQDKAFYAGNSRER
jgi:hypothetical protein